MKTKVSSRFTGGSGEKKRRNRGGRPRLSVEEKQRRGTVRPCRERKATTQRRPRSQQVGTRVIARDYVALANGYVTEVLTGVIVACVWIVKACQRFLRMRERAEQPGSVFVWSPENVQDVCAFVEKCPHVEGKWNSATIQLEPCQVWWLAAVYGFRLRSDRLRRLVTVLFFVVARKSAKSTLLAALGLYHMARESEPGAQVICGASTGQQARIVFGVMQRMIRRSAWLREQGFKVWANSITFGDDASAKPINSKSSTQDGLNPSFICLDESHAQDFGLFDVLKSAQGARTNPLLAAPTTAGYSLTSVGYALRSTAMKILDGVIESDHSFVALYELDPDDDWRDESTWIKSAPMIGITPTLDYLRRYRDDAIATPGLQGEFEVKVCNRWLHSASSWLSITNWDACADTTLTLDDFAGELACIGGDLAQKDDMAALAIAFERGGLIFVFVKFYLPAAVVEQRSRAVPVYRIWADQGLLTLTEGNTLDEAVVEADVRALCEQFDVRAIAFDQFGSAGITTRLANDGLPAVLTPKNAKTFSEPSLDLEVRVRQRMFRHDGNPILRWNASNACVSRRVDGSILPKKEHPDSANKIDGLDAVLLAMGALGRSIVENSGGKSVWEDDSYELVAF